MTIMAITSFCLTIFVVVWGPGGREVEVEGLVGWRDVCGGCGGVGG